MKKNMYHNTWKKNNYETNNLEEFQTEKIKRNVDINKLLNRIKLAEKNHTIKNFKFSIMTVGILVIFATFLAY